MQTTYWGSRPELAEVLDLAARGLLRPTVTTFTLERALGPMSSSNEATGRPRGRGAFRWVTAQPGQ